MGEEAAAAAPAEGCSLRAAIGIGCVGAAAASGAEAWGVLAALPARARCKEGREGGRRGVVRGAQGAQAGGRGHPPSRGSEGKQARATLTLAFFSSALRLSFSMRASIDVTSDSKASGFISDMAA